MNRIITVAMLGALAIASTAHAQVERAGNADSRIAQQLQQLTGEKASLQAENTRLKGELEQLRKELQKSDAAKGAAEARTKALEAGATRTAQGGKQAEEQLERTRGQLQELIGKFRETAQTLRDVDAERGTVKSQLATRDRELTQCVDRNAGLYNLNTEVLGRMENRGFWSTLSEREPFTKLARVELENLIEDYKYRALELRQQQKQASAGP